MLDKIRELRASGHTLRQIADELNRQGFRTRCGSLWRHQYVRGTISSALSNNRQPERAGQDNSSPAGSYGSPPSLTTPHGVSVEGCYPLFSPNRVGSEPRSPR